MSPYLESEIWEQEELLTIIKYQSHVRNKAILTLLWDLDARPHEITLLKIPPEPKVLWNMMNTLKIRITRLLEKGELESGEADKLRYLLMVKKWK